MNTYLPMNMNILVPTNMNIYVPRTMNMSDIYSDKEELNHELLTAQR